MALYNQGVFVLLIAEMLLFVILVLPLPWKLRRKLFKFIAESPAIAKLVYGLKITFIFISILFIDAVQHMVKVQKEGRTAKQTGARADSRSETDWRSRKFLSERNMYLTGFTLFLSIILNRTYNLILELIAAQEQLAKVKGEKAVPNEGVDGDKLKALQKDYDELSARYNKLEAGPSNRAGGGSKKIN